MKYVIIGGGIGGLTMAAFLQKQGREVVVSERLPAGSQAGQAFLLHMDAWSVLEELTPAHGTIPGERVDWFILRRPSGEEVKKEKLLSWRCLRRDELTDFLEGLILPGTLKRERIFSHFIRRQGRVTAAVFSNGEVESGDIFIGADGGNSQVRRQLFGDTRPGPILVKEIVGVCTHKEMGQRFGRTFQKFQHSDYGLSFGLIPTGHNEFVWFMQYDPSRNDLVCSSPESLRAFCLESLRTFPPEVGEIIRCNDFSTSYIWNTRDFDPLPSFHRDNVVLLGDAAQLTLPFVSSGTTNAILGAKALLACIGEAADHEQAFRRYHELRATAMYEHVQLGRQLRQSFLRPAEQKNGNIPVPLLSTPSTASVIAVRGHRSPAPLQVLYFTDPICSTCWLVQPALKKITLEYGHHLQLRYHMGGLLPSWSHSKGKIQSPADATQLWGELSGTYNMPVTGEVWTDDPLASSFPPSIAFKAAQMQGEAKALLFLRRIREMVFLEAKNIMRWEYLEQAAREAGLEIPPFRRHFEGEARLGFHRDLQLARHWQVTSFPTLILSDGTGNIKSLKGYFYYQDLEHLILQLQPGAAKQGIDRSPAALFRHFPTMVEEEFALLSDLLEKDARPLLQQLHAKGYIEPMTTRTGHLWKWSQFR